MAAKQVAIVIPFYKESITAYEEIALQQCKTILFGYPVIAVKPQSLTLPPKASLINYAQVISFDERYFAGIAGYNSLMLSQDFYAHFLEYEYILIYQPDAFVFSDQLNYWCNQDFDYIGAPWIRKSGEGGILKQTTLKIQHWLSVNFNLKKGGLPNKYQFENKVGNGGFSLRRVRKFYNICSAMKSQITYYLQHTGTHQYNEDAFWSVEVNRKEKVLNIPSWQTGLNFAFETYPQRAYELSNNHLPFGCHDWDRYIEFWRPVFKTYGYQI